MKVLKANLKGFKPFNFSNIITCFLHFRHIFPYFLIKTFIYDLFHNNNCQSQVLLSFTKFFGKIFFS